MYLEIAPWRYQNYIMDSSFNTNKCRVSKFAGMILFIDDRNIHRNEKCTDCKTRTGKQTKRGMYIQGIKYNRRREGK